MKDFSTNTVGVRLSYVEVLEALVGYLKLFGKDFNPETASWGPDNAGVNVSVTVYSEQT